MPAPGAGGTSRFDTAASQDPTESASRGFARNSHLRAASRHGDMMDAHYTDLATRREADLREAEWDRENAEWRSNWESRQDMERRFTAEDPEPYVPDVTDADYSERIAAWSEWADRKDQYEIKVESEALAARLVAGRFHPWTR